MRAIAWAIILTLLTPLLMQLSVMTWYQANQRYISQVLCENREMPEMNCDGKCVLAQKLKQAQREQTENEPAIPEIELLISPFILNQMKDEHQPGTDVVALHWRGDVAPELAGYTRQMEHPPPHC